MITACRDRRYTHIDRTAGDFQRNTTILRQAFLCDVEPRHDLNARDNGAHELTRYTASHIKFTVNPIANHDLFLFRLDMDIARSLLHRSEERRVGKECTSRSCR